jgi:hypothetical protein
VGYDEVVGVKLLDEGGSTRFAPALYLVEVAHQDARRTLLKCGEAFTFGVTLGAGGAAGVAGGRLATAVMWCDRAAVALGAVTSVVDEHRAWILERYGEKGARFLRYSDGLSALVAFYAVGRLATAAPKVLVGLRNAYLEMKALKAALSAEDQATLELLGRRTDEAVQLVERGAQFRAAGVGSRGRAPRALRAGAPGRGALRARRPRAPRRARPRLDGVLARHPGARPL